MANELPPDRRKRHHCYLGRDCPIYGQLPPFVPRRDPVGVLAGVEPIIDDAEYRQAKRKLRR